MRLLARAPGKVNLCLFLGPVRTDGRHELVTVFESVSLADEVTIETVPTATAPAAGLGPPGDLNAAAELDPGDPGPPSPAADQVVCPGVPGFNIVAQTLDGLRTRGWDAPPLRVTIEKRIPVAGGMGGGSADAAAVLRMARSISPVEDPVIGELAATLGADVPSQLVSGMSIGTGAGEIVERRAPLGAHAFVVVPHPFPLSTAEVYREADRLGLARSPSELAALLDVVREVGDAWPPELLDSDLERAALSLRPEIAEALDAVLHAGAEHSIVSGSGPTVLGLCWGEDSPARAAAAAARLAERYPGATSAVPVSEEFAAPRGS